MITAASVIKPPMWCPGRNGHELWRGCVLYLPLWEGSGTTAMDLSGNSNHGTLTGMDPPTDWVILPEGRSLEFAGDPNYVNVPDAPCFDITTNLSVFFLGRASGYANGIFGKYTTDKREWGLAYVPPDTGKIRAQFGDPADGSYEGSWITSTGHLTSTVSKHCGFTFDNGTVVIYVNGVAVPSGLSDGVIPATLYNGDEPVTIGKFQTIWDIGCVSIACIWNRTLSAGEVAELGADPFCMIRPIAG